MAGSTMQVQSAISLLYVHWNPDKSHINCNSSSIRVGLARLPVLSPMGEPNTLNTKIKRKKRKQKQLIILIHRYL